MTLGKMKNEFNELKGYSTLERLESWLLSFVYSCKNANFHNLIGPFSGTRKAKAHHRTKVKYGSLSWKCSVH